MKILVISLLRIGDLVLQTPAIYGLRQRYPNATIDLLVNDSSRGLSPLIPYVSNFIYFERKLLQDGLVQADRPLLEPYDKLKTLISKLSEDDYDIVINLTQNKLSGYLTSMIKSRDQLGLAINSRGQPTYGSPWFKYLNDVVAAGVSTIFHYGDIFYYGLGLPRGEQKSILKETDLGRCEVEELFKQIGFISGPKVVIQALTSDKKKNWGIESWVEAIVHMRLLESGAQFILLGAPSERSETEMLARELSGRGVNASVAILSLEGAFSLLNMCDLLITGDTSIKHLANSAKISILEIALGSSDVRKTGSYKNHSLILRSREFCVPCSHEKDCHRTQHYCGTRMAPELVGITASHYLHRDWGAIELLAREYNDDVEFLRVEPSTMGIWQTAVLSDIRSEKVLSEYLDRAAWQFLLEKEHLNPLGTYGSQGLMLKNQLESIWGIDDMSLLRSSLDHIENRTLRNEEKMNKTLSMVAKRFRNIGQAGDIDFVDDQMKIEISNLERDLGLGHFLTEKLNLNQNLGIFRFRQLQASLSDTFQHQQIKLKLLRSLKNQIMESQ